MVPQSMFPALAMSPSGYEVLVDEGGKGCRRQSLALAVEHGLVATVMWLTGMG